jgi:hypothetical protein
MSKKLDIREYFKIFFNFFPQKIRIWNIYFKKVSKLLQIA